MSAEDEDLCLRCGRCCHEKIRVGGHVVVTDVPCPFLDTERRTCRVYAERFARQPNCAAAVKSAAAGGMPGDCPYVRGIPGYPAPLMLADHPEYLPLVAHYFPGRSPLAEAWKKSGGDGSGAAPPPESRFPSLDEINRLPLANKRPLR